MIGAGLPEHVAPVHPPIAAEDVLQRVVERMAHVQIAGDVRRRDDDAEGFCARPLGPPGAEGSRLFPKRGDAAFDLGGVERFVHHGILATRTRA